jgi:hypothetical protein
MSGRRWIMGEGFNLIKSLGEKCGGLRYIHKES